MNLYELIRVPQEASSTSSAKRLKQQCAVALVNHQCHQFWPSPLVVDRPWLRELHRSDLLIIKYYFIRMSSDLFDRRLLDLQHLIYMLHEPQRDPQHQPQHHLLHQPGLPLGHLWGLWILYGQAGHKWRFKEANGRNKEYAYIY